MVMLSSPLRRLFLKATHNNKAILKDSRKHKLQIDAHQIVGDVRSPSPKNRRRLI